MGVDLLVPGLLLWDLNECRVQTSPLINRHVRYVARSYVFGARADAGDARAVKTGALNSWDASNEFRVLYCLQLDK